MRERTVAPFFSVVMNCRNSETYLREAIESVRGQTFSDWEIVFWDNQSTDRSAEIVRSFDDPRIRYFYAAQPALLGEARNLAVGCARGEWIAFLDCDDIWLPRKLERQAELIRQERERGGSIGLVYGRTIVIRPDGKEVPFRAHPEGEALPEGEIFERLIATENFIPLVSAAVLREAYGAVGGIPGNYTYAEDYYLFLEIAARWTARAVQEPCCKYRQHSGSLSSRMTSETWLEAVSILERWKDRLDPALFRRKTAEYRTLEAVWMLRAGRVGAGLGGLFGKGSLGFLFTEGFRIFLARAGQR